MVALTHVPELAEFPPDLIAAIKAQAESDADAAADFIRLSVQAAGNTTLKLDVDQFDPATIIGFGLVARFWRWERQHIRVHIDAGLPCAADMLLRMVKLGRGRKLARFMAWVMIASTKVFHDSFLWAAAGRDLQADLVIVGEMDERHLDAIAEFLLRQVMKTQH